MRKPDIAAIILTYNEEKHIERCISSIREICKEIFVIDSLSTDRTEELAMKAGATQVLKHPWKNYATQFNWGLENAPITAEWVWRIDADEFIERKLGERVVDILTTENAENTEKEDGRWRMDDGRWKMDDGVDGGTPQASSGKRNAESEQVNGIYVRKRIDFLGRALKHGGWYPQYHLKLFRRGFGACENRWMDEHIRLSGGKTITIDEKGADQVDANLNDLTWWTQKHNGYATREMVDMLMIEYGMDDEANEIEPKLFGSGPQRKRWLKLRYVKSPLFVRPFLNFVLRYILKGGFLDGKEGLMWHFMQGWWYRFLVDAKIWETKKRFGWDEEKIKEWIKENYQ